MINSVKLQYPYFHTLFRFGGELMLAKKISKNQITLPKAIASRSPGVDYFDVREEDGRIALVPLRESRADEVSARLQKLGIAEDDVADAVWWLRQ